MTINNATDQTKLVIIKGSGTIRELGNICAPILTPQYIAISTVAKIVSSGRTVLEVNPADKSQTVKLTLANVRSNNFPAPAPAKAEPAKTVTPAPAAKKEEKKTEAKVTTPAPAAKVEAKTEPAKTPSTPASDFSSK